MWFVGMESYVANLRILRLQYLRSFEVMGEKLHGVHRIEVNIPCGRANEGMIHIAVI